jgi:hypothetical protein
MKYLALLLVLSAVAYCDLWFEFDHSLTGSEEIDGPLNSGGSYATAVRVYTEQGTPVTSASVWSYDTPSSITYYAWDYLGGTILDTGTMTFDFWLPSGYSYQGNTIYMNIGSDMTSDTLELPSSGFYWIEMYNSENFTVFHGGNHEVSDCKYYDGSWHTASGDIFSRLSGPIFSALERSSWGRIKSTF